MTAATQPALIAHVVYRLGVGGLENGLVNLINCLPASRYRHMVVSLTDYTDFAARIRRDDVELVALNKRPGHDWRMYRELYRLFRARRPDIVHSRNLAALEAQVPAWLAGVPCRVHGEHGRDVLDVDGTNWKYIVQRRLIRPCIHHYIALSRELEDYLTARIRVAASRITRIINGVDVDRFAPSPARARDRLPRGFSDSGALVIGTVGRLEEIKDQMTLVRAFIALCGRHPEQGRQLRLVIVGDGSRRAALEACVRDHGLVDQVWFAGSRDDVPELLQALDLFVLPSLAEGISNTIMEAMASGLPVVASDVGGNSELVSERTGTLVPRADPEAMAKALESYLRAPERLREQGRAARRRAQDEFSLATMVGRYGRVYERLLGQEGTGGLDLQKVE